MTSAWKWWDPAVRAVGSSDGVWPVPRTDQPNWLALAWYLTPLANEVGPTASESSQTTRPRSWAIIVWASIVIAAQDDDDLTTGPAAPADGQVPS